MGFPLDQYRRDIHGRGRVATLLLRRSSPADSGAPWEGSATPSPGTSQSMIMKFKTFSLGDADGDSILDTDQIVQIFGPDLTIGEPSIGDEVIDDGATLTIKGVSKKQQGDTVFRYDLHVGR